MKHFNAGFVWGRIAKLKLDRSDVKGTPYLSIELDCPNELFGNVRAYGRLWGAEKIDALIDFHKGHPGAALKLQGFFSQYDKDEDTRYSNYTFFSWQPVEGKEFRATFVLTGEVTGTENMPDGDGLIHLYLVREGKGSYEDAKEVFQVFTLDIKKLEGLGDGALVQVKGVLRYKEAEDYFGAAPSGPVRPYVMEIKVLERDPALEVF